MQQELAHHGRMPDLAIVVTVNRLYFHCAKCMILSGLWQPEGWRSTDHLPSLAETMVVHAGLSESIAEAQARINRDAVERLY